MYEYWKYVWNNNNNKNGKCFYFFFFFEYHYQILSSESKNVKYLKKIYRTNNFRSHCNIFWFVLSYCFYNIEYISGWCEKLFGMQLGHKSVNFLYEFPCNMIYTDDLLFRRPLKANIHKFIMTKVTERKKINCQVVKKCQLNCIHIICIFLYKTL